MKIPPILAGLLALIFVPGAAIARETITLAADPALSPDGRTLAFSWRGDIWLASSEGGKAHRLTRHPARDAQPAFSPDGAEIAFTSDRSGSRQIYVVRRDGGDPEQLTHHTEGFSLEEWSPDGQSLLVRASRDGFWRHAERFFLIPRRGHSSPHLLFDGYGSDGRLSPDGKRLLFTREGSAWWRKGYRGSQASQIWQFDLETGEFSKLVALESEARWPLWDPSGNNCYYVGSETGSYNLRALDPASGATTPLTRFNDDSVVFPCLSRDGSTIVFRHLFDLYRFRPQQDKMPQRLEIIDPGEPVDEPIERRLVQSATEVAFSDDGLEIALIAGGDLWVMDTELREPHQVTSTPEEERNPVFSPDGKWIHFVSDAGGQCDIWRAHRRDEEKYWWQEESFPLERITQDSLVERDLRWSPDAQHLAYIRGGGDLWTMEPDGKNARRVLESWNDPDYRWSPDGKWFVYAVSDADYNRDIWIIPADGSRAPVNISRHPDNESGPVWSPDGKMIAFTGRRIETEVDIYYVWLREGDEEKDTRDRKLEKAIETMTKARKKDGKGKSSKTPTPAVEKKSETPAPPGADEPAGDTKDKPEDSAAEPDEEPSAELPEVVIDFERIHERLHRIAIPDSAESGLFWGPESKKLAFQAAVDGRHGTYTVEFPDKLQPERLTSKTGSQARWLEQDKRIVWLSGGVPASLSTSGKETAYPFSARQEVDRVAHYRAGFDLAWRIMRDAFYDGRMNNRNWDAVRRKYSDAAAHAPNLATFGTVMQLMLGELNASHMGFYAGAIGGRRFGRSASTGGQWSITTAHLGLRFDPSYPGPGLRVRDVIPGSPAEEVTAKILPGEILLAIDHVTLDPAMDRTKLLNGPLDRDISLDIRAADGTERAVTVRPISYAAARGLLYDEWVAGNRKKVDETSSGTLGYMHIRGMNMPSFHKFENELYAVGAGKDGIIIDVRENGGGFTADHLLTVLCQPRHAITVGRGGGPGYPQDRKVYATWTKPIVVLCNQNSFSNAEIFSHAIKTLHRGQLVGVPTAGGVISTGGTTIMDLGFMRLPGRGWFVLGTGEDMELNGAVPDHVLWSEPGELPAGIDRQLDKAVEVLAGEVTAWKARPHPKPRRASER